MVKHASFVGIGIALLAFPLVASAACVNLTKTLAVGSSGTEVTALQTFLRSTYANFPTPTGYFGPTTQAAVMQWQGEHSIAKVGMTGPQTRAAMACGGNTSAPPTISTPSSSSGTGLVLTRNLAAGSSGSDVLALQQFLVSQGLLSASSATGYYGSLTQAAVQKYQAKYGIVYSGTPSTTGYGAVGTKTRASIALVSSSGSSASAAGQTAPSMGGTKVPTPTTSNQNAGPSLSGATSVPPSSGSTINTNLDLTSGLSALDSQTNSLSSDASAIDSALSDTPITQISL